MDRLKKLQLRRKLKRKGGYIHPLADVSSTNVGAFTRVWQFSIVMDGAVIGENCNIGAGVFVEGGASIGSNTTIKNQTLIWNGVKIGNDVFIGPSVVFTNAKYPKPGRESSELSQTVVEDRCVIGAGAVILPGLTLGEGTFISAGAIVTRSTKPGETWIDKAED